MTIANKATTGIGSLPHHNADAALSYAFQMGVPFLPQIPIRNPWEFMVPNALEDLPGLQVDADGAFSLNPDIWMGRTHALERRLHAAFEAGPDPEAFEAFEPANAASSCWQPFLWELQERETPLAKVQIAGPMTAQWALKLKDGSRPGQFMEKHPELASQIYRLVLARAIAMTRRLKSLGIEPLLYIDEPGLYGLSLSNPRHVMGLQELKLMIQTLRKEGAQVGLHCCSNTNWPAILGLPLHYLSIDTALSLESLLASGDGRMIDEFLGSGGRLSLGVIPTSRTSFGLQSLHSLDIRELYEGLWETLRQAPKSSDERARKILREAMYTPACGLAFQSTADAEFILAALTEFHTYCAGKVA